MDQFLQERVSTKRSDLSQQSAHATERERDAREKYLLRKTTNLPLRAPNVVLPIQHADLNFFKS